MRDTTGSHAYETVRQATCPIHGKQSNEFVGENIDGWVFRCGGWSKTDAAAILSKRPIAIPTEGDPVIANQWHYFTTATLSDETSALNE